ncbi:MAG: M23 family metallopeptidase [bacterium]|nr:M23 family metallopeptidase [bacterium]
MSHFFDDPEEQAQNEQREQLGEEALDRGVEKAAKGLEKKAAAGRATTAAGKAGVEAGEAAGERGALTAGGKAGAEAVGRTGAAVAETAAIEAAEEGVAAAATPETFGISEAIMLAYLAAKKLPVLGSLIKGGERALAKILEVVVWPIAGFCITCCGACLVCCLAPAALVAAVIALLVFGVMNLYDAVRPSASEAGGGTYTPPTISVSKTASPVFIVKCASGTAADVEYRITVQNNSDSDQTVSITDSFDDEPSLGTVRTFSGVDIAQGETWVSPVIKVRMPSTCDERVVVNTVRVNGGGSLASTVAFVTIGNPVNAPPQGCPIVGTIFTPLGINIPGYTYFGGTHYGMDISDTAGTALGSPVHSTLTGSAVASVGRAGNQIVTVTSPDGVWQVKFLHLAVGTTVSGPVVVGQVIGTEDNTGVSGGTHVHYEIYKNGAIQNPFNYTPSTNALGYIPDIDPGTGLPDYAGVSDPGTWGTCNALPPGS